VLLRISGLQRSVQHQGAREPILTPRYQGFEMIHSQDEFHRSKTRALSYEDPQESYRRVLLRDAQRTENLEKWKTHPVMKNSDENLRLVSQEQQYEDEENAQPEEATQGTVTKAAHKQYSSTRRRVSGRNPTISDRPSTTPPGVHVTLPQSPALQGKLRHHCPKPFHIIHHASMARVWIEVTRSLTDRTRNRQPTNSLSPHLHHQSHPDLDISQSAFTTGCNRIESTNSSSLARLHPSSVAAPGADIQPFSKYGHRRLTQPCLHGEEVRSNGGAGCLTSQASTGSCR